MIAREATDRGSVIGLRIAPTDDENAAPWANPPSRKRRPLVMTEPLPRVVRAVLAQRLFVDKSGLPSPLINEIKRLAAFQNLRTLSSTKSKVCASRQPPHPE